MQTNTVKQLIRARAEMQAAARNGSLVIFPSNMDSVRDFRRLGIQHLHQPHFTTAGLLADRPICKGPRA
ncbi:hypothetical protein [Vogesella oryzae]|uniref:hypothetical protein n=1 Tax=Vogesella oryzae TaxID=1735285 RepID=UPI0015822351|nr:hypothetical protein [Vogesella oryzae]